MGEQNIDHANAERLAALLHVFNDATEEDEEAITIDTLDGYITALICGPVLVSPIAAMDALFGEDWPAFLEEREALEDFNQALHLRWNEIAEALNPDALAENPDAMLLTPLITEFDEATKAQLLSEGVLKADQLDALPPAGVLWVEGFMQAVDDFEGDWYSHPADSEMGQALDALLMAVAAVALPPGDQLESYVAMSYEADDVVDQEVLLDDALYAVQDLRLFWLTPPAATQH